MTFLRVVLAALVLALAAPAAAAASDRFVVRDEPVPTASSYLRATAAHAAPRRFNLVGLHWQGPGIVSFRTLSETGKWTDWQEAEPEDEDAPDIGSGEGVASQGWRFGNPYWTGPSTSIQYRFEGTVSKLRAYFLWSAPSAQSSRSPSAVVATATRPSIIRRAQWGADESIVRAPPSYASALHFAVVHHTAGTNSYSASESAAIVRGIQRYHVLANGWNDIGYNFLVDKYGQVFEGRGGGMSKNVIGAHAQGFNTGSTGVAVLGTYESKSISPAARAALVRLLAWRLDVAHVDPLSRLQWISGGNPKYPAGTRVTLRAISGHRDTGPTSCPGDAFYAQLPRIAQAVAATGLPKLYSPAVRGGLGGPVRFTARLSSALDWTVTIRDTRRAVVASGSGSGTAVDWTWDATAFPAGSFRYVIAAGPNVRPATGIVPGPPPLEMSKLDLRPGVVTPNGDGVRESTSISYRLSMSATVKAEVLNASGAVVRSLVAGQSFRGGSHSLSWDGRDSTGTLVRDGRYVARVTATAPGQQLVRTHGVVVDRTLGFLEVSPTSFSPNGDGRLESTEIGFLLSRQATVRVRIMAGRNAIAVLHPPGTLPAGAANFKWDGKGIDGRARDGTYRARVDARTSLGTRTLSLPLSLDTLPPVVRVVWARLDSGRTHLKLWLSEPGNLLVRWGSPSWSSGGSQLLERPAGYSWLWLPKSIRVRMHAVDAAQNIGAHVTRWVRR